MSLSSPIKNSVISDLFKFKWWEIFIISCGIFMLVSYLNQNYILTDELYYNSFGEQFTFEKINDFLSIQKKWQWFGYVLIPISIFIQVALISICLNVGVVFFDYKLSSSKIFKLVMQAFLVFALAKIISTFIQVIYDVNSFDEIAQTDWFSLLGWINLESIPQWMQYPLGIINLFEILFIVILAKGVSKELLLSFSKSLSFIFLTYGIGLSIWLFFVVFIQLSLT